MVQVEPSSHAGQAGAAVSHLTQRLKTDRAERTAVAGQLIVFGIILLGAEVRGIPLEEKEESKDMMEGG